ncbi:amino acid ABC transporter membrane protein, PAAT family (TC 3.A.1.3.-) [Saccharopolyspora kobensis]|uniref:Amino acid ABC transporter membrane protein, PAAT family n=1 Tax=Saccharopolyspora kobensis TaxID=146035 RepID=A0A1H6EGJ3_9PSEU|nr:amino acid ABC transporter permease [Saccharopolyspora kobensis]SEG96059.1 amino acid ABC transporter membrane protein, PAAT family (TC 3.A.1.3.-) [Saccharopolyspora kobensis]SFD22620.1 amino acid ABC transporter membrane protein, PAAT family [Saccharopolyspora kobensis]
MTTDTERPKSKLGRRQRARLNRGIQYAVLVVVLVVVALVADWSSIARAFFNVDVAIAQFPAVITTALVNTIIYTALGFAFGLALGVVLALMKMSSVGPYRWIATGYIELFRGLPALLVFIALGFGVPIAFQLRFDIYSTAMLALGLVGAAYMAETIRAGIQAVPRGQIEAARSLGMSPTRTMITVVMPQAFRIILPPLTNELILLTKDSSLIYLLGLASNEYELAKYGRAALNEYASLTPLLIAGLCYLIITIPLSRVSNLLERKYGGAVRTKGGHGGAGA